MLYQHFLEKNELRSLDFGRIYIKGDELFANIDNQASKSKEDAVLETHSKYIDIQIPITADEVMGYIPKEQLPECDFNEENDAALYPVGMPATDYLNVTTSMFAIFFPQDGHAPAITPVKLKKIIVKVAV